MSTELKLLHEDEKSAISYQKISNITDYQAEMIAVMHKTVAKGTSISELAYFLSVCKSIGLNPLNKEVWCYKDKKGNLLVFTGRDGFLKKAQDNPKWNGMRSCEVREEDVFRIDVANNKITHEFGTGERGKIIGAYCRVFVKDSEPTLEWVKFSDYNKSQFTWADYPSDMIRKVAECHALKKAFGMSNLHSEYDFEIKNEVALPLNPAKPEPPEDKSEDRILKMIENAKNKEALEKLFVHCGSQEASRAYDKKLKTFL